MHTELHARIRGELASRKAANPRFSLRALAGVLEMSPAHLSLFLSGKKGLSPAKLRHVAGALQVTDSTIADFVRGTSPGKARRVLAPEELSVISDWHYFAILSLAKTPRNSAAPAKIARALGITVKQARDAVSFLKRAGYLSTAGGKLAQLSPPLRTQADVSSAAVRAYHRRNLELAAAKLDSVPVEDREFGSLTFAVDAKRLRALKEHVRKFLEAAPGVGETPAASRVYTLAIQLFPLTQENS